jgi:hypothetical protein
MQLPILGPNLYGGQNSLITYKRSIWQNFPDSRFETAFYSHTMAVSRIRYVEGRRSEIYTSLIIWIVRIFTGLQGYVFVNLLLLGSHSLERKFET